MTTYSICKRCGAPHDDGTADYCFKCLDEKEEAPEGVQELKDSICINCAYCNCDGFVSFCDCQRSSNYILATSCIDSCDCFLDKEKWGKIF